MSISAFTRSFRAWFLAAVFSSCASASCCATAVAMVGDAPATDPTTIEVPLR